MKHQSADSGVPAVVGGYSQALSFVNSCYRVGSRDLASRNDRVRVAQVFWCAQVLSVAVGGGGNLGGSTDRVHSTDHTYSWVSAGAHSCNRPRELCVWRVETGSEA